MRSAFVEVAFGVIHLLRCPSESDHKELAPDHQELKWAPAALLPDAAGDIFNILRHPRAANPRYPQNTCQIR